MDVDWPLAGFIAVGLLVATLACVLSLAVSASVSAVGIGSMNT